MSAGMAQLLTAGVVALLIGTGALQGLALILLALAVRKKRN